MRPGRSHVVGATAGPVVESTSRAGETWGEAPDAKRHRRGVRGDPPRWFRFGSSEDTLESQGTGEAGKCRGDALCPGLAGYGVKLSGTRTAAHAQCRVRKCQGTGEFKTLCPKLHSQLDGVSKVCASWTELRNVLLSVGVLPDRLFCLPERACAHSACILRWHRWRASRGAPARPAR